MFRYAVSSVLLAVGASANAGVIQFGTDPEIGDGLLTYTAADQSAFLTATLGSATPELAALDGGTFQLGGMFTDFNNLLDPTSTDKNTADQFGFMFASLVGSGSPDWQVFNAAGDLVLFGEIAAAGLTLELNISDETPSQLYGDLIIDAGSALVASGDVQSSVFSTVLNFDPALDSTPFNNDWTAAANGNLGEQDGLTIGDGTGVPEPFSMSIVFLGLAALLASRQRAVGRTA